MVIKNNLGAMNAGRHMGIVASGRAKSTEKLSSGYQINRAADNAAGLAISEKMRKQVRGWTGLRGILKTESDMSRLQAGH